MSSGQHKDPGRPGAADGYEKRDVNVRTIAILVLGLLGGASLSLLAMGWMFGRLALRESNGQAPPSSLTSLATGHSEAPEPRLQSAPALDLKNLRASEEVTLTSYGWVDRKSGVVRIPIERAIDIVAGAGLPVMPVASASVSAAGSAPDVGSPMSPGPDGSAGPAGVPATSAQRRISGAETSGAGTSGAGTSQGDAALPAALQGIGIDQRLGEMVPLDLGFRDETGREVRLQEYFGKKPVILTLNYYECPMLCTLVLNGLVSSMRTLSFSAGKEFTIVTVSINPRETPALAATKKVSYLHDYGRPGAAEGWHFLTGDADAIKRLAEAAGFRYRYDPLSQQYAHAAGIMVLTPEGRLARYFYGVEFAPRDLRLGLIESSEGKIGTFSDQILLFCFHYDPATGKYGTATLNLMRTAGVLTVVILGGLIYMMLRREARRIPAGGAA